MDFSMISTVVAITVICYLIGMIAKTSSIENKWIPVVVGVAGGILGIVGLFVIKDFPAEDIVNAIAVGIVSGLASTGADQIKKLAQSL